MISVALFFTPALLLFKNRLPLRSVTWLAGAAAILRALEIALPPAGKMLAGGFTIAALVFLLIILVQVFTTENDYIPVIGP